MIIWADTETTGLDPRAGHLLEVACVLTDDVLEELASFTSIVLPVGTSPSAAFEGAAEIVREMHTKNGLIDELRRAYDGLLPEAGNCRRYAVEDRLRAWVAGLAVRYSFEARETPLAGSTIGFDRRWLNSHMPAFESGFHYRSIDVSTLTELARRWSPAVYKGRPKAGKAHRALADVRESISYLRYYRQAGFIGGVL